MGMWILRDQFRKGYVMMKRWNVGNMMCCWMMLILLLWIVYDDSQDDDQEEPDNTHSCSPLCKKMWRTDERTRGKYSKWCTMMISMRMMILMVTVVKMRAALHNMQSRNDDDFRGKSRIQGERERGREQKREGKEDSPASDCMASERVVSLLWYYLCSSYPRFTSIEQSNCPHLHSW